MEAAVVGFEGDALLWYQWEHRRRPIRRWEDMRSLILKQFRPLHSGTLCEQWLAVKQTGTVAEFRRSFIEMAAPLEQVPEAILLAHFINGLKDDIKAEVRMLGLYTLELAMELALKVEEKNRVRSFGSGYSKSSFTTLRPNPIVPPTGGLAVPLIHHQSRKPRPGGQNQNRGQRHRTPGHQVGLAKLLKTVSKTLIIAFHWPNRWAKLKD